MNRCVAGSTPAPSNGVVHAINAVPGPASVRASGASRRAHRLLGRVRRAAYAGEAATAERGWPVSKSEAGLSQGAAVPLARAAAPARQPGGQVHFFNAVVSKKGE